MKNWFKELNPQIRKNIVVCLWIASAVIVYTLGTIQDDSFISDALVLGWFASLIFAIVFSIWNSKFKKEEKLQVAINIEESHTYTNSNISETTNKESNIEINTKQPATPSTFTKKEPIITPVCIDNFTYPNNQTYFFVDVETANQSNDSICALGAIIVKNGKPTHLYSLINPQTHITNTRIHGISDRDVINAPTLEEYWSNIADLIDDNYIIIGHNISFDIAVLNKHLETLGIDFSPTRKVDTMTVAKDILYNYETQSGDLKLDTICQKLNISLNHHNAESDILATKQVFETLLVMGNRNISDFINIHYASARDIIIGNIKNVSTSRYWDDIDIGRTPIYFTNWKKVHYDSNPQYDDISLEELQFASMMDRENCGIPRVVKQVGMIKSFIESIGGKIYGKGAKKAKCYIEFYYMDLAEYIKLKGLGYKIYHAIDVENFIKENTELIQQFILEKEQAITLANKEKERLIIEQEEKRAQREAKKLEAKESSKRMTRKVAQLNDDGEVIQVFDSIANAVKTTGTNSKSIRDCCTGVQKHAGGFVWKYIDNDESTT